MKKQISPLMAAVIIIVAGAGIIYLGWNFAGRQDRPLSDVTPLIKDMNVGKEKTESFSPEFASEGALMMGSKPAPKKSSGTPKPATPPVSR